MFQKAISRKKRAKQAPKKRPPNAFLLFCKNERPSVCRRCPGMAAADISSLLSHLWRSLDEGTKARYKTEEMRLEQEYAVRSAKTPVTARQQAAPPRPRATPQRAVDPSPRSVTLDLPHLSTELSTAEPLLPAIQQPPGEPPPTPRPARAVTKRFDAPPK
jgi:hypothetical protein